MKPVKPRPMTPPWTGITAPDCNLCSWSWRDGKREIKYVSAACPVHRPGPAPEHRGGGG